MGNRDAVRDAADTHKPACCPEELDNYRRIVELQTQIVELARRNREVERSCQLLRRHLERQHYSRTGSRMRRLLLSFLERIRCADTFSRLSGNSGERCRAHPGDSTSQTNSDSFELN